MTPGAEWSVLLALLADPSAAPQEPASMAPVVVTAEKMGRPKLDTYSSISVIDADAIATHGVRDVKDALRLVPNAGFTPTQRGNNGIVLRGINSEGVTGPTNVVRPLSAFVVDGVTQSFEGARRGVRGLYDIEQVEVARGPQSTLQGRNALAGAVLVRTADPQFDWTANAQVTLGELDTREAAATVSGPLVGDTVAFRVTAETLHADKGIDIRTPGLDARIDEDEYRSLRAKLLVTPASLPDLRIVLTSWQVEDEPALTGVTGPDWFARRITTPLTSYEFRRNRVGNQIAEVSYALAPGVTLRSTTSFTRTNNTISTPGASILLRDEYRLDRDWAEDARVEFARPGSAWSGLVGLFLGHFDNTRDSLVGVRNGGTVIQSLASESQLRNQALFGEVRWRVAEPISLVAGLRHDREDYASKLLDRNVANPAAVRTDTRYDAWLPKLGVAWHVSERQRLALTGSRGYRGGFVEVRATDGSLNRVDPETLDDLELAWRFSSAGGRLEASANLFHYRWRDQQVSVLDPDDPFNTLTITLNAGRSTVKGAELELAWRPTDAWRVSAGVGLLRTRFEDFVSSSGDFTGAEFPEAPRRTAALASSYRWGSGWFAAGDVAWTDDYFSTGRPGRRDNPADANVLIPGYARVGVRVGYEAARWSAIAYVRNLFDKDYLTGLAYNGNEGFVGDPRQAGVVLRTGF